MTRRVGGSSGGDNIGGGTGMDAVLGEADGDGINGEDGADAPTGGNGADTMRGGDGANDFVDAQDRADNDGYAGGAVSGDVCRIDGFDNPLGGFGNTGCESIQ